MKNLAVFVFGFLLAFGAFFAGSYVIHILPIHEWYTFPTFFSTCIISGFSMLFGGTAMAIATREDLS